MLQAPRLAAKLEILPIFDHKIRINNAQIIGAQVSLYQQNENEDFNFTYLLKAFAGKDTTQKNPINLRIGSLLMRNCDVRFNRWQEPLTPGRFNLNHLNVEDFNITATLRELTPDSINATIKDKYFNSAASTPATIFPFLDNLCQKHLRKINTSKRIWYEQQIRKLAEVFGEAYPSRLSLPQQGSFNLGYYHQTQKRYEKKEDK